MGGNLPFLPPHKKISAGCFLPFLMNSPSGPKGEKIPRDANLNMKLQQKQLMKYGVEQSVDMISCGSPISLHKVNSRNFLLKNLSDPLFPLCLWPAYLKKRSVPAEQQRYSHQKSPLLFHQSILDLDLEGGEVQSVPYDRPGCGALAPVDQLASTGCPYCGNAYDAGIRDWVVTDLK